MLAPVPGLRPPPSKGDCDRGRGRGGLGGRRLRVGRIMGHRCLQTTLRYAHLWADGTKDGVKRLGEVLDLTGKANRRRKGKA